jgi:hypothetical protein
MTIVRAHLLVGGEVSNFSTTRRGTAAAGMIPVLTMPSPPGPPVACLVRGAILRKADMRVPIRVLQNGGQPIHTAPTRRGNPQGRSPPPQLRGLDILSKSQKPQATSTPKAKAEGMPPNKEMSDLIMERRRPTGGGIPSFTIIDWRVTPGPSRAPDSRKGHP